MRVLIQRVSQANVKISGLLKAGIKHGMLIFIGIEDADDLNDLEWLCNKIIKLRIFDDENGVMNLSVDEVEGEILMISQFTLHASTKKGARPSYIKAAHPDKAIPLYNRFILELNKRSKREVKTGEFGAEMLVELINNGPVTILIDSKSRE
jgi:D-tyrosyl-tRNA(Tyr) deacylase